MTRETKIGLLVGLAFIIIVGILLSEPLSHSSEVQPAPLPGVGSNVRSAVATPGSVNVAGNPPISMQGQASVATPQQTVPTQQEVARPRGGIGIVIGPGATQPQPRPNAVNETKQDAVAQDTASANRTTPKTLVGPRTGEVSIGTGADPMAARPENAIPKSVKASPGIIVPPADNNSGIEADPLAQAAKAAGEELEPFGKPRVAQPGGMAAAPKNNAKAKGPQEYEVQPGDSLGKIAAKFYGSSAKPYQDAIVAANPSLKGNPNKILVGVAYVIPAVDSPAAAASQQQPAQPTAQAQQQVATAQQAAARTKEAEKTNANEHWYTVKERDTLWGIAKDQVGDPNAIAAIKELNKDSLKGGETVRVGMKLKLPAKAMASAS